MVRKLTTEEVEILMLLNEITEQLETYGYVDEDSVPTYAGKRYLELFMEYVKKQKEQPQTVINNKDTVVNNSYSLISIEELKLSLVGSLFETNNELIGNVNMIISKLFNK